MAEDKQEKETPGIKYKKKDFAKWYPDVVVKSGMADYSPIAGCMIIRPHAYAIWESIQKHFDKKLKDAGHRNAYFPLFIPEKFLKKEAEHFEGFTPEVAWVEGDNEKFALRPTSETIIYDSFSKWIRSWRDLPLLVNQWCNIVRWETKVTRLFLRTREFLWQEGHTAHITKEEADKEVKLTLDLYRDLIENQLAIPILIGEKTPKERFPGALYTMTLEALMPDGKALQMGTTHNLGQNFSKPFGIKFIDRDKKEKYVWQTSWGVSTRLIGALIMVHGDDKGLVLPPRIAPIQVVIVPIVFEKPKEIGGEKITKRQILKKAEELRKELSKEFSVKLDSRETYSPGWKFNEWEMRGVPLRIEIGPKDISKNQVVLVRRDTGEKKAVKIKDIKKSADQILENIQKNLFARAKKFLKENTVQMKNYNDFKNAIKNKKMVKMGWCGDQKCEDKIQEDTAATIRLVTKEKPKDKCICGKKAKSVVYAAKQY